MIREIALEVILVTTPIMILETVLPTTVLGVILVTVLPTPEAILVTVLPTTVLEVILGMTPIAILAMTPETILIIIHNRYTTNSPLLSI